MKYLKRLTPVNEGVLVLTLVFCVLGARHEERLYRAPPLETLKYTDGRLTVYSPARSETAFKVYLQGDGVGMCCILFNGFYGLLKRYEGRLARVYWSYIEGLDRNVGFEIYLIDESGAEIKQVRSYRSLKSSFEKWSKGYNEPPYFFFAALTSVLFLTMVISNKDDL